MDECRPPPRIPRRSHFPPNSWGTHLASCLVWFSISLVFLSYVLSASKLSVQIQGSQLPSSASRHSNNGDFLKWLTLGSLNSVLFKSNLARISPHKVLGWSKTFLTQNTCWELVTKMEQAVYGPWQWARGELGGWGGYPAWAPPSRTRMMEMQVHTGNHVFFSCSQWCLPLLWSGSLELYPSDTLWVSSRGAAFWWLKNTLRSFCFLIKSNSCLCAMPRLLECNS